MKFEKYYMGTSLFLTLAITACGSSSAKPAESLPDRPVVSAESTPDTVTPPTIETPVENPAIPAPAEVDLMAAEMAAYERAKPVFEEQCAGCHTPDTKRKKPKKGINHFAMGSYPFDGHHKTELGQSIRVAIGATDKPATMPQDDPGSIEGTNLEVLLAWSDAFDAAAAAGVGYHGNEAGGHGHKSKHEHKKKDHDHKKKEKKHDHKPKHKHKKKHDHKPKHEHKKKHDH